MRYLLVLFTAGVAALAAAQAFGLVDLPGGKWVYLCLAVQWALGALLILALARLRRYWLEYLLAAGGPAVALVAAEFGLRAYLGQRRLGEFRHRPSERYHHILPPHGVLYQGEVEGKKIYFHTNEDGLRTPYSRVSFHATSKRIALLGDSFVFGWGVSGEALLDVRLQADLRAAAGRDNLGVLNAGMVSYSPLLERRLYQGVVRHYAPQLVLLLLDPTDIGDDYHYARDLIAASDPPRFKARKPRGPRYYIALGELLRPYEEFLSLIFLYPFRVAARCGWQTLPKPAPERHPYYYFKVQIAGETETSRFFIYRYPLDLTRPYFERSLDQINRLAADVQRDGGRFALVLLPRYHHWSRRECPDNWERQDYGLDEPYQYEFFRFFEEQRAALPYPVINLLPAFQATTQFPLVFKDDPHWNEAGHALAARLLSNAILEQGLLSR